MYGRHAPCNTEHFVSCQHTDIDSRLHEPPSYVNRAACTWGLIIPFIHRETQFDFCYGILGIVVSSHSSPWPEPGYSNSGAVMSIRSSHHSHMSFHSRVIFSRSRSSLRSSSSLPPPPLSSSLLAFLSTSRYRYCSLSSASRRSFAFRPRYLMSFSLTAVRKTLRMRRE